MRKFFLPLFFLAASVAAQPGHGPISGGSGGASGPATELQSPVVIEGTADAFEGNFTFADPTADWTWAWGAAGDLVGAGSLSIDNLKLDGNTISSTDTDGNIALAPNGSGRVVVPAGSLTSPGIAVSGITGTGFTFDEGGQRGVSWVDSDQSKFWIGTADVRMQSDFNFGWTSSATNASVTGNDTVLVRSAAGIVGLTNALHLTQIASPPRTCDATAEGDIYTDTSHALCWCDGTTWQKLSGAGTCA